MANNTKAALAQKGKELALFTCKINNIPPSSIGLEQSNYYWGVNSCAYYRYRNKAIRVCVPLCAGVATERQIRNWNFPGNTVDRTPYGVVCHELGHHFDCHLSKGDLNNGYTGAFSTRLRLKAGEESISSYGNQPDAGEWWAEIFRLFCTNHYLLAAMRPATYNLMTKEYLLVPPQWYRKQDIDQCMQVLGEPMPERIAKATRNKIQQGRKVVNRVVAMAGRQLYLERGVQL